MAKNDQVLTWLFQSLEESISAQKANEKPARNLLITFEIVQKLSELVLENNSVTQSHHLFVQILNTFEKFFH